MSLSREIVAALDGGAAPGPLAVAHGPHALTLDLTAASPVGAAFTSLEFRVLGSPERSIDELKAWGDRLAARVTYLMEPLVVLEVDAPSAQVELRSSRPTPRPDRRLYYEVRLRRDASLTLARIAFDESSRTRETIPCQLTREVLEHLADDLAATAP